MTFLRKIESNEALLSRPFHTAYAGFKKDSEKKGGGKELRVGVIKPGVSFRKRLRVILDRLNGNQANSGDVILFLH